MSAAEMLPSEPPKKTATTKKPKPPKPPKKLTKIAFIISDLDRAREAASGGGDLRYSPRQLYYAVRHEYLKVFFEELDSKYFDQVITSVEKDLGHDLPGIYRGPRGTLYVPHSRESIAIGTFAVEDYKHAHWTFNKVLFIEKEGFFENLKAVDWPERNDCALLTSKGQSTRAIRDLIDKIGDVGEPVTFFCVHDADGYGTCIYQALQDATKARPGRRFEIVNLGLEPAEALEMGLEPEAVNSARRVAVADYVPSYWKEWLQTQRVELNVMSSAQFLEWIDRKVAAYGSPTKVVPPTRVLSDTMVATVDSILRDDIRDRLIAELRVEERTQEAVDAALRGMSSALEEAASFLTETVSEGVTKRPATRWTTHVRRVAEELARPEQVATEEARDAEPQDVTEPTARWFQFGGDEECLPAALLIWHADRDLFDAMCDQRVDVSAVCRRIFACDSPSMAWCQREATRLGLWSES